MRSSLVAVLLSCSPGCARLSGVEDFSDGSSAGGGHGGSGLGGGVFTVGACGFRGVIDEVALYSVALSAQRVAAHYQLGSAESSR